MPNQEDPKEIPAKPPALDIDVQSGLTLTGGGSISLGSSAVVTGTRVSGLGAISIGGVTMWDHPKPPKTPETLDELREFVRPGGPASHMPMDVVFSEAISVLCDILDKRTTKTCLWCGTDKMCHNVKKGDV